MEGGEGVSVLEAKAGKAGAETRVRRLHGSERLVPVRVQPQPAAQAQGSWKLRLKKQQPQRAGK